MAQSKYAVSDARIHGVLRSGIHSTTELSQRFGMSKNGMLKRLHQCPGIEVTAKVAVEGARGAAITYYWGLMDRHAPTLTTGRRGGYMAVEGA